MTKRFKVAMLLFILGMTLTLGGALLKIFHYSNANHLLISGLVSHFGGAGLLVGDLISTRKLS